MLAHQGLHPAALAMLDRCDDHVMLPMRVVQNGVIALRVDPVEGNRLRAGERDAIVPRKRLGKNLAAGFFEDEA